MSQIQNHHLNSTTDKINFKNLVRNETEAQGLKCLVTLLTHSVYCTAMYFLIQHLFKLQ